MNVLTGLSQDYHRPQSSPGGYEWWHFDGEDPTSAVAFTLDYHAGNLSSAYYQQALKDYWEKTRSPLAGGGADAPPPTPPNPLDYCGVTMRFFRNGSSLGEALLEQSGKGLKASDHLSAFMLGANRFNWDGISDPPSWVVTAQAPVKGGQKILRARLFFTPEIHDKKLPQALLSHSTHTWILAAPRCRVEGTLQWCDAKGDVEREEGFVGTGAHDHYFGSVPLDRFIRGWHWGRAFLGETTVHYSWMDPLDPQAQPEGTWGGIVLLAEPGREPRILKAAEVEVGQGTRNFFLLPYKKHLLFKTEEGDLEVLHGSPLSDGPVELTLPSQVRWKGSEGTGLSHFLYPPRLSSKWFFPMLKGRTTAG